MKRFSEAYADSVLLWSIFCGTPFFLFFLLYVMERYMFILNVTCDEIFVLTPVEFDLITHIFPTFTVFILK